MDSDADVDDGAAAAGADAPAAVDDGAWLLRVLVLPLTAGGRLLDAGRWLLIAW